MSEAKTAGDRWSWGGVLTALWLVGWGLVWPVWSHRSWQRGDLGLHAVPALAVGWLVVVVGVALGSWVRGLRRGGWRWMFSRGAMGRGLSFLALAGAVVALFYAVELWRGRQAWVRVTAELKERGVPTPPRWPAPTTVSPEEDFAQAPMFEPLRRLGERGLNGATGPVDLGRLQDLQRWAQSLNWTRHGIGMPSWMRGESGVESLRRATRSGINVRLIRDQKSGGVAGVKLERTKDPADAEANVQASDPTVLARSFLESVEPLLPLLEEARGYADRPHCRLPFDHGCPFLADNSSERVLLAMERLAFSRAQARAVLGQGEESLADLRLGLRIARHGRSMPALYLAGWHASALAHGMHAVWEGLDRRVWTEPQLKALQVELDRACEGVHESVLRQMRNSALASADFLEGLVPTDPGSRGAGAWTGVSEDERGILEWFRLLYPTGWSLQNQAAVMEGWLRVTTGVAKPQPETGRDDGARVTGSVPEATSDPFYRVFIQPKFRQMFEDAQVFPRFGEVSLRLAEAACAVGRYREARGKVPESWEQLVEWMGTKVTGTPVSQPRLRYRSEGDGFVLYAEGLDGRDDGGGIPTSAEADPVHLPDWVWVGR